MRNADPVKMPNDDIHNAHAMRDASFQGVTPEDVKDASTPSDNGVAAAGSVPVPESEAVATIMPRDPKRVVDVDVLGAKSSQDKTDKKPDPPQSETPLRDAPQQSSNLLDKESSGASKKIKEAAVQITTAVTMSRTDKHGGLDRDENTPSRKRMSGEAKLAYLLGKGDFQTEAIKGQEVVDASEYQKPALWNVEPESSQTTTPPSVCPVMEKKASAPAAAKPKPFTASKDDKVVEPSRAQRSKTGMSSSPPLALAKLPAAERTPRAIENGAGGEKVVANVEVDALRAELASQAKWEGVRLQEAVRAQLVEDTKASAKEMAELEKRHADEITRIREEARRQAEELAQVRTRETVARMEEERESEVKRLLVKREEELKDSVRMQFAIGHIAKAEQRECALMEAEAEVKALSGRFGDVVRQTALAKEATRRANGAFLLREAIGNCTGMQTELAQACGQSELGALVARSVPESALQSGVQSVDGLKTEFARASKWGLRAAIVPEEKRTSVWAHLLASVFWRLKVPVDLRADGDDGPQSNEERIRLAQHLVQEGDIEAAVRTLEVVDGLAGQVLEDWVKAAKARLAAGLAADVLLADALISQVALTDGQ